MSRLSRIVPLGALVAALLVLAPSPSKAAVDDVSQVWARDLPGATIRESSPVFVDLDADGMLEIAFGAHDKKVWALKGTTGATQPGWPQTTSDKINSSPSAADVDRDGRVELFIGSGTSEAESGALYSFEHDGTQRFRLSARDKSFAAPAVHSTPAIGNVDGSPDPNVSFGTLGLLSAWSVSSGGNVAKGCAVDVEYPDGACWPFYTDDTTYSSPALADADADGTDEVIIGSDSSPGAPVDHQGGVMRAIKSDRSTVWQFETDDIIRSSPSVGNIDADAGLEVVFGTGDFWGGDDSIKVFALNVEDGTAVAGWPVETDGVTNASPTLADLDADGILDVAIGTFGSAHGKGEGGSVHAWKGDGTAIAGFPVESGGGVVLGQIVTADVDADGGQDLIVTTGGLINVLDGSSGASLFTLAEGANVGFQNSAAVADVDADGRLDLVAAGTINTAAGTGRVYRWELGPEAVLGDNGWHQFRLNQHKTGSFSQNLGATTALAHSRLAGDDRYATAAEMSERRSPDGVDTVYVATGEGFADALAGGPAANVAGGTVLLVTKDTIPDATDAEIERLEPTNIIVLGGTSAVSDAVLDELDGMAGEGGSATRIAGTNRAGTAAAISAATFDPLVPVVYIANGDTFPDALAGAAAGAFQGGPVLLVTKDSVPPETGDELRRLLPRSIVILGGTGAVSEEVEAEMQTYTLPPLVSRAAGDDRYETAVAVSQVTFTTAERVFLATGLNFPDALAGGPVAADGAGPLLLVPGTCVPAAVRAEIQRLGATRLILLGGSAVTSPTLASMQSC